MTYGTRFKLPLVVVDRWSLFKGSFSTKIAWAGFRVVVVDRWSLYGVGRKHKFDCIYNSPEACRSRVGNFWSLVILALYLYRPRGLSSCQICQLKANDLAFAGRMWPGCLMMHPSGADVTMRTLNNFFSTNKNMFNGFY